MAALKEAAPSSLFDKLSPAFEQAKALLPSVLPTLSPEVAAATATVAVAASPVAEQLAKSSGSSSGSSRVRTAVVVLALVAGGVTLRVGVKGVRRAWRLVRSRLAVRCVVPVCVRRVCQPPNRALALRRLSRTLRSARTRRWWWRAPRRRARPWRRRA